MTCGHCKKEMDGTIYTTDELGYSHLSCYAKAHPFVPKTRFREVLNNLDDPRLAKKLIDELTPNDIKKAIIIIFNEQMLERQKRRENAID